MRAVGLSVHDLLERPKLTSYMLLLHLRELPLLT